MFAFNARFTVLAVFCCISAQWLLPSLSAHGAVISRNSLSSTSPFQLAANDPSSSPSQHVFPWSHRFHKVRSTNPIQQLADAMFSRIKHGHQKRSHKSIVIPTGHGKDYLLAHRRRQAVTGTPQWITGHGNSTNGTMSTQSIGADTPGIVQIKSQSSGDGGGIWSLQLKDRTLIASKTNPTRFYLEHAPNTHNAVSLSIPQYLDSQDYCATYDPSPNKPEPMTMQPCGKSTGSGASGSSQVFMYDEITNDLRPAWNDGSDSTAQTASMPSDTTTNSTNGTKSASGLPPSSRSLSSRDDANIQNVTLKWVPDEKVATADVSESPEDTQISDSTSSAVTTTTTQTVTVFQTGLVSSTLTSTSGVSSSTGLNVEVVGGSPASSSVSPYFASSMSMMDAPNTFTSSPPTPSQSQSIDAAAIASSIAASASASMSSYSASSSPNIATAADVSSSSASSTASSDPSSNTFVAAVIERAAWVRPEER